MVARFAFPQNKRLPAFDGERRDRRTVPLAIAADLVAPVVGIGFWLTCASGAVVPMPETAMNEDDLAPGYKNEVRRAGKILAVKSEPITERVRQLPNPHLQ